MKKWFVRIIVGLILLVVVVFITAIVLEKLDYVEVKKYTSNENLKTVKADWQGTPVDQKGRFVNAETPFLPKVSELSEMATERESLQRGKGK